jgi:hypothetical protein
MFFLSHFRITTPQRRSSLSMRRLLLLLLILLASSNIHAQLLGIGRKAKAGEAKPKAVLVEILTRKNQREFIVNHRPDLLPEFNSDVEAVAKRTRMDWSQHFRFCPVYFFIDTLADKVKQGEFAGILLDSALKPVENPVIAPGERNIYIAYYGIPIPQPDTVKPNGLYGQGVRNMEHDGDETTSLIRQRLLVNDADFRLLSETKPRTNYVRAIRPSWMGPKDYRHYRISLTYNASRWYIDYMPVAYSYDQTLRRYFR